VVYLRNCNHSRRIVVRTQGAPTGRLILPGATTAMAVDPAILADPLIQRRLAAVRLAVLDRGGWCADLRQRRAEQLSWSELIAQAERAEMARVLAAQLRQRPLPATAVVGGRRARTAADTAWLREQWARGTPRAAIAARLGITPQGVSLRAKALGLALRSPHFQAAPQSA
jgi:hypothetical protein